jgi:single-stranded-DNA-specific exonuclease
VIIIKYKLYKEEIPTLNPLEQILYNRDIPIEKQKHWLFAGKDDINNWRLLDENKVTTACDILWKCINNNEKVQIVVDCDTDGYTSGSILANCLYNYFPSWVKDNLSYIMHEGKEHGLSDVMGKINNDAKMIFCPDGASNDREQHKILAEKGITCVTLDHHQCDKDSDYAIVINHQINDYPDKALTGAGVTWQFCRAFEEIYNLGNYTDDLVDLCAIGNCGDMADYRENEIRAIMNIGLTHFKNHFLLGMTKKNEYSINKMNGINYYSMAFYVVPYINAAVRCGTSEEKELIFKSMLNQYADELIPSSKRGEKGTKTPRWVEAITVIDRIKRRQTKLVNDAMFFLENKIQEDELLDNAILLLLVKPGEVEKNLTGLVANKLMAKYQRPCLVLVRTRLVDDKEDVYRGSARNYSLSEIQNLKTILDNTGDMVLAAGHEAAFGAGIAYSKLKQFIKDTNKIYSEIDQSPTFWVDYVWKDDIPAENVLDIAEMNIYGQGIPESLVCVKDFPLSENSVTLMGLEKGHPTIKIQLSNGVEAIKFKSSEEEFKKFTEDYSLITFVAKCGKNEWNGSVTPQLIIEDYKITKDWAF